jgi:hypothetical protein
MSVKRKVAAAAATLTLVGGHPVVRPFLHQRLQQAVRHAQVAELHR